MDHYTLVKHLHITAVTLSAAGFVARGVGALAQASWVRSRLARSLPHVIDSVLLASALTLAWMAGIHPTDAPWLLGKIIGLLVYIGLGVVALRPATPPGRRWTAFGAALLVLTWIIGMALTKQVAGPLVWLGGA